MTRIFESFSNDDGSPAVWDIFIHFWNRFTRGQKTDQKLSPKKEGKQVSVKNIAKAKPRKKSLDLDTLPGSYWTPFCNEDSDPITLETWADHKRASDIVSLALPSKPGTRLCYAKNSLLQTLRNPSFSSPTWLPSGKQDATVYRNPRGQYMDASTIATLQRHHSSFQLVPLYKRLVGNEWDDSISETIYTVKPIPLPG
jgi:hypothetical protein